MSGYPPARVVWWQGGEIVDSTFVQEGNVTINSLDVPSSRRDLREPFTCSANNNDVTPSLTKTYMRNVTCAPLSVEIRTEDVNLIENRFTRFECIVIGSNPPPEISWFIDNNQIFREMKTKNENNRTVSFLDLHLRRENHRNQLVCRAKNHLLPLDILENILTLDILYKPAVHLALGRSLNASKLKESNDVFFECEINANPPPYKVQWFHEGSPLVHNVSAGVLVSEKSLALQRVSRLRSGRYQCSASNVEGDTISNNITIKIQYAPRCVVSPSLRGVALGELTNVTCVIDADPANVTFTWEFNNSVREDTSEAVSQRKFSQEGTTSVLSYTPLSERDYGTLSCYATNSVGRQKKPCSFTVISAGPPERVNNCTASNMTSHSVGIRCEQGFDGGLPQSFLLQVFEARSGVLVLNATKSSPAFSAKPLEPGMAFHASVTSFNSRGRSSPTSLKFRTLREAAMHKILPSKVEPSPLIWVAGVIFGIIFVVAALLLAVWIIKKRNPYQAAHPPITTVVMKENNPDLINMEGSEERLSEIDRGSENCSESLMVEKSCFGNPGQVSHRSVTLEGGSYARFDDSEPTLFVGTSPDINEKTRLTSPRSGRRDRRPRPNLEPRKQAIVRLHTDTGPESTF